MILVILVILVIHMDQFIHISVTMQMNTTNFSKDTTERIVVNMLGMTLSTKRKDYESRIQGDDHHDYEEFIVRKSNRVGV